MSNYLLQGGERQAIEAILQRQGKKDGKSVSFEALLGFLSGVTITPGIPLPSHWLQPLLDMLDIVFEDAEDANRFMGPLMMLYNQVNYVRLRGDNLFPFQASKLAEDDELARQATAWAIGLHSALTLRPQVWAPSGNQDRDVPLKLREQIKLNILLLWGLAEPERIPEIIPDPAPFQRRLLAVVPGWQEDMMRETWDEDLVDMFKLFTLAMLRPITDSLQQYAEAFSAGASTAFPTQPISRGVKVGRNEPCPCGSGLKFKKCCGP